MSGVGMGGGGGGGGHMAVDAPETIAASVFVYSDPNSRWGWKGHSMTSQRQLQETPSDLVISVKSRSCWGQNPPPYVV